MQNEGNADSEPTNQGSALINMHKKKGGADVDYIHTCLFVFRWGFLEENGVPGLRCLTKCPLLVHPLLTGAQLSLLVACLVSSSSSLRIAISIIGQHSLGWRLCSCLSVFLFFFFLSGHVPIELVESTTQPKKGRRAR